MSKKPVAAYRISSNGKLWKLAEPEYVNKRRKEIGLESLEDYLKHFDIDFNVPQKE